MALRGKLIPVDVVGLYGKTMMVMALPTKDLKRDKAGNAVEPEQLLGYKVQLGSREYGIAGCNVKLPKSFDTSTVVEGDLVELVEPTGTPYGQTNSFGGVDLEITVSAKGLRKAGAPAAAVAAPAAAPVAAKTA